MTNRITRFVGTLVGLASFVSENIKLNYSQFKAYSEPVPIVYGGLEAAPAGVSSNTRQYKHFYNNNNFGNRSLFLFILRS